MASLVRLESGGPGMGYWYAVWRTPTGRRRSRSIGSKSRKSRKHLTRREALQKCAALQAELADLGEVQAPGGVPTLRSWLRRFVAQRELKKTTIAEYEVTVGLLVAQFGDARLDRIGKDHAADFRAALRGRKVGAKPGEPDSGARLSESTIRKHIRNCKALFGEAVRQGLIRINPYQDQVGAPLRVDQQWRYISPAEGELLLSACPSSKWRVLFALARYAGLRLMEALHLEWADIDHDRRVLIVRNRNRRGQQTTKDKERLVPVCPELHRVLLERFEDAEAGEGRVVGLSRGYFSGGGGRDGGRTVATLIYQRAKVPKGDPFHDLRRSLETDWLGRYPVTEVAKMLGHSPEVAQRFYNQVTDRTIGLITGAEEDAQAAELRVLREKLARLEKKAGMKR